jgi:hypothetical protein
MLQVLYLDVLKVDWVLCLSPCLLLLCILLKLRRIAAGRWRGRATGWHECELMLSPSVIYVAGSASVPSVFLLGEMLRWDSPVSGH